MYVVWFNSQEMCLLQTRRSSTRYATLYVLLLTSLDLIINLQYSWSEGTPR